MKLFSLIRNGALFLLVGAFALLLCHLGKPNFAILDFHLVVHGSNDAVTIIGTIIGTIM
jgi:hypothetical protein